MEMISALSETLDGLLTILRRIPTRNVLILLGVWLIIWALGKIKIRRRRRRDSDASENALTDYDTLSEDTSEDEEASAEETERLSPEEEKGRVGEDLIADILYESVPGEFEVFRNLYVPYRGATTELDIVMIHETGVFVFESKNYVGWIYGDLSGLYWTQMLPNYRKRSFYNPIRQNRNHIKALSQYLNMPPRFFRSCIVFSDECELRKVPETSAFTIVTQTSDLEERLQHMMSALPLTLRPGEVRTVSELLLPLTDADSSVKEKHIERIRDALESDVCPFCGGKLVVFHGKRGDFWGCSNYPMCGFKRNVM